MQADYDARLTRNSVAKRRPSRTQFQTVLKPDAGTPFEPGPGQSTSSKQLKGPQKKQGGGTLAEHHPEPTLFPNPPDFPFEWANPEDANMIWMHERQHSPGPVILPPSWLIMNYWGDDRGGGLGGDVRVGWECQTEVLWPAGRRGG